jgi:hypothetical protein
MPLFSIVSPSPLAKGIQGMGLPPLKREVRKTESIIVWLIIPTSIRA